MASLNSRDKSLLIVGILLIAFNLRPALAGLGPLVAFIRIDTGLSNTLLGLLTTLPLLAFGIISTLTPLFTRRLGIEGTLTLALFLLALGSGLRVFPQAWVLFLGTALLGIGIAFGNVLLPSLVKRNFPKRSGFMTSMYSGMMGVGAALAAGVSVPLTEHLALGWRGALGIWSIPAVIALLIWLFQLQNVEKSSRNRSFRKAMKDLGKSSLAWKVALFMGLQSLAFYVVLAWLPDILQSRGMDSSMSGWMLSLSQAMGVVGSLVIPTWAGKYEDQRFLVWMLIGLEAISLIGLMFPTLWLVPFWVSAIGFALGGSFGLALLFIVLRSTNTETATELSGMSQSIGYSLAAIGPILIGAIFDVTQSWFYPLLFLFLIVFIKLYMGLGAAKPVSLKQK